RQGAADSRRPGASAGGDQHVRRRDASATGGPLPASGGRGVADVRRGGARRGGGITSAGAGGGRGAWRWLLDPAALGGWSLAAASRGGASEPGDHRLRACRDGRGPA